MGSVREKVRAVPASYAVWWREDDGPIRVGKLEVSGEGIRLEAGTHRSGQISVRHVLFRDVHVAQLAEMSGRIADRPTVLIRLANSAVWLAPAGVGAALDVLSSVRTSQLEEAW